MVTRKTTAEVDAEKAAKPRPDLVPGRAILAAARAFGYGAAKHGTPGGRGTYRIAGDLQSRVRTHAASLERHWQAIKSGEFVDPESGLSHLDHMAAQLSIVIDLMEDPPGSIDDEDRRWYTTKDPGEPLDTVQDAVRAAFTGPVLPLEIRRPGPDDSSALLCTDVCERLPLTTSDKGCP